MTRTGCCAACHYRRRLRKDGTLGLHYAPVSANVRAPCPGVGKPDAWAEQNRLAREWAELTRSAP